jgi:hypothetical protein
MNDKSVHDMRDRPETQALLRGMPAMASAPMVQAVELAEVRKVVDALPRLEFPINSAGALADQIDRHDQPIMVSGIRVDVARMLKYMPAYYFPIASYDNFVEKMADLIRQNRPQIDIPAEAKKLREQLPAFTFPIQSKADFARAIATGRTYRFQGGPVDVTWALGQVPEQLFPIRSEADLHSKLMRLIARRPLITGHPPAPPVTPEPAPPVTSEH